MKIKQTLKSIFGRLNGNNWLDLYSLKVCNRNITDEEATEWYNSGLTQQQIVIEGE